MDDLLHLRNVPAENCRSTKRSIVSARRCRNQTSRIPIRYRRLWRQQSQSTRRKWYRNAKICWDVIQRLMQHQRRHVRRMYRRRPEGSMERFYIRAKHFPRSRWSRSAQRQMVTKVHRNIPAVKWLMALVVAYARFPRHYIMRWSMQS